MKSYLDQGQNFIGVLDRHYDVGGVAHSFGTKSYFGMGKNYTSVLDENKLGSRRADTLALLETWKFHFILELLWTYSIFGPVFWRCLKYITRLISVVTPCCMDHAEHAKAS